MGNQEGSWPSLHFGRGVNLWSPHCGRANVIICASRGLRSRGPCLKKFKRLLILHLRSVFVFVLLLKGKSIWCWALVNEKYEKIWSMNRTFCYRGFVLWVILWPWSQNILNYKKKKVLTRRLSPNTVVLEFDYHLIDGSQIPNRNMWFSKFFNIFGQTL